MKGALRLRPVPPPRGPHPLPHPALWLGLLPIRVIEHATGDTWRNVRNECDRMHLVTLGSSDGRIAERSVTTKGQQKIFAALEVREPAQILDDELPTPVELPQVSASRRNTTPSAPRGHPPCSAADPSREPCLRAQ